ncbi:butyrate kinase [Radiobacillus sp. PE A8.2]|uniref:butyrate kinase n=1 Tax=Radiobacillus sp. PE A8.2 TaxID=3380349 RepID=UPI00388E7DA8
MEKITRILVINPISISTKIALYDDEHCIFERSIFHPSIELANFNRVIDQLHYRKKAVLEELDQQGINISKLRAVCGRGGLLKPITGGTYQVNNEMLQDLRMGYNGEHISNLGGILSFEIANGLNIPAFIVDPVVVDELDEIARVTGVPEIRRKSIFHALNHKAVAREIATALGKAYSETNLIVAHLGGGITVGAHRHGQVIDVNNGLDGDGPFSPERAGTVPAGDLIEMCYSGQYSRDNMLKKIAGTGGLQAYFQKADLTDINAHLQAGNKHDQLICEAMAYQVAKQIGAMSVVLQGQVDAIAITGDLAYSKPFVRLISSKIDWISDVFIYPGQNEMQSLALGTLRVLRNQEEVKQYPQNRKEEALWHENMT